MREPRYSYTASIKSDVSDELINTWLIRPLAGMFVGLVYRTGITPNQVTIVSTLAGLFAAWNYLGGTASAFFIAGLLVTAKDVLDAADGQLARAKQQFSRRGRFLDSIGDFVVNAALFAAIGSAMFHSHSSSIYPALAFLGFLGTTLRVSYHVYYQTAYLHLRDAYRINRLTEEVRAEDESGDSVALVLQRVFQVLYGWQDRLMGHIDRWCRKGVPSSEDANARWYSDSTALRLSGLLGLGTEMFLLTLFSLVNALELYLVVNAIALNGIWVGAIVYRKLFLVPRATTTSPSR